jgi:hypothetical protein
MKRLTLKRTNATFFCKKPLFLSRFFLPSNLVGAICHESNCRKDVVDTVHLHHGFSQRILSLVLVAVVLSWSFFLVACSRAEAAVPTSALKAVTNWGVKELGPALIADAVVEGGKEGLKQIFSSGSPISQNERETALENLAGEIFPGEMCKKKETLEECTQRFVSSSESKERVATYLRNAVSRIGDSYDYCRAKLASQEGMAFPSLETERKMRLCYRDRGVEVAYVLIAAVHQENQRSRA